ncbi:hypothetical protein QW71_05180 [Paenibacillus sp. IHB B 3415]|nr:hypothetical protein QW71_05180 [Paenibacillus sp. IHB B 3415]
MAYYSERVLTVNYDDVYKLHLQLLSIYEKNARHSWAYQRQIDYFKRQLLMFTEDNVQRIFVLNQLLKIHEKTREALVNNCADQYFSRSNITDNEFST